MGTKKVIKNVNITVLIGLHVCTAVHVMILKHVRIKRTAHIGTVLIVLAVATVITGLIVKVILQPVLVVLLSFNKPGPSLPEPKALMQKTFIDRHWCYKSYFIECQIY